MGRLPGIFRIFSCALCMLVPGQPIAAPQPYELPEMAEPSKYGNVLIDRQEDSTWPSVSFSHWSHRMKYTCRVCHFELGFVMKTNATEITEQLNRDGEFCGACHDGETAFGHTSEYCVHCHNYGMDESRQQFDELESMPFAPNGNQINWNRALDLGLIEPVQSIYEENYQAVEFKRELDLKADWAMIPRAEFPHEEHMKWLDCADCHPGIFNIKKKTTEFFDMRHIVDGRFCGVCHLKVAFPLNDCKRCHPKMRDNPGAVQ